MLIVLSFTQFPEGGEGLISILAWFPIAFAMYNSFSVDVIAGYGATSILSGSTQTFALMVGHTIYHFDVAAAGLFLLLLFALGNTVRIWLNAKRLNQQGQPQADDVEP